MHIIQYITLSLLTNTVQYGTVYTVRDAVPGTHVYPVVLLYINVLVCNDYNEVYEVLYCTVRLLYTIMYEDV